MQKNIILNICDRCGYRFYEDVITSDYYDMIMNNEEKEMFRHREILHEVNGVDLCPKCYKEYNSVFDKFMENK